MIPSESSSSKSVQVKYKEGLKKEAGPALYHLLPETADTQRAKHMSEIQSEVLAPPPTAPPSQLSFTVLTYTDCFRRSTGGRGRSWPTRSSP